jgi:hypothetical protein
MHPKKSYSRIKIFICTQGAPCVHTKIFIWQLLFQVHFVTKLSLYFWNISNILRLLIPIKPIFDPYVLHASKRNDICDKGRLIFKTFFCYFPYFFLWKTIYVHLIFALVPTSTHPTVYTVQYFVIRTQLSAKILQRNFI